MKDSLPLYYPFSFSLQGFLMVVLFSFYYILFSLKTASAATFDVTSYGAKGDGNTDDSQVTHGSMQNNNELNQYVICFLIMSIIAGFHSSMGWFMCRCIIKPDIDHTIRHDIFINPGGIQWFILQFSYDKYQGKSDS